MVNFLWENLFRKTDRSRELEVALKGNYLFETLSARELHLLRELVHDRTYKAGEAVFRQGEIGIGMYIILSGKIDILVEDPTQDDRDRQSVFVTRLTSGDFLGESSLVEDNLKRTATALAAEESHLLGFYKPDLIELIERSPATGAKISQRLAEVLARRLRETTSKVTELKREIRKLNSGGKP